jgi:hypothetical protein
MFILVINFKRQLKYPVHQSEHLAMSQEIDIDLGCNKEAAMSEQKHRKKHSPLGIGRTTT